MLQKMILLALLTAWLCLRIEERRRAEEARWLAGERERQERERLAWKSLPAGSGLDVAAILPRIARLRQEPLAALQIRPHQAFYRRALVAVVRQTVKDLSFFRRARPEHELVKP
jgi:hypothetical protein